MASPYNMGYAQNAYPQAQGYPQPQGNQNLPSVFGAAGIGMVGGSAAGYYLNRFPIKDGIVSDTFASEALNTFIDKGYATEDKSFYKQMRRVLKKIDKITKPEKFRKLVNKNPDVAKRIYNTVSTDTVLETVTKDNIREKAKTLKNALEAERQVGVVNMKHAALEYWDETQKKFIKPTKTKDIKTFKALKATKNKIQWKKALKYGGICAGILGGLTVGYRMLLARPTPPVQNPPMQNFYGSA